MRRAIVWCFGAMQELVDMGLVNVERSILLAKGVAEFDQLDASGYRPNEAEIRSFVDYVIPSSDPGMMAILLEDFARNRERMRQWNEHYKREDGTCEQ